MIGVFSFFILGSIGAVIGFFSHPFEGNFGQLTGKEFLSALSPYILSFGCAGVILSYFFPRFMMFIIDLLFGGKFNG